MSDSALHSRLETLRWRFESAGRHGGVLTLRGLLGLAAVALLLFGAFFAYAWSAHGGVPALARALLFLGALSALLVAAIFIARSLINGAGDPARADELHLNPGLAAFGRSGESGRHTGALEHLSTRYGIAIGRRGAINARRSEHLAIGWWGLLVGAIFPALLLAWSVLSGPPTVASPAYSRLGPGLFQAAPPHEISQDRSVLPAASAAANSELDGACCLFEDRRPTRK